MIREHFLIHLEHHGCEIVRTDKNKGYSVIRNIATRKIYAVPPNSPLLPVTICLICMGLGIEVPELVKDSQNIADEVRKMHDGTSPQGEV